jgi:acetyl esterase/lipase
MIKPFIVALFFVFTFWGTNAQTNAWQPSAGHTQVPIWPGAVPDGRPIAGPEFTTNRGTLVAGQPWVSVEGVSQPTMTVYSPTGTNTGVAMIIFPGGGFGILAIDLEGTEVCDWLTSRGITAVLLKYRVPGSGGYTDSGYRRSGAYPRSPMALEDAQRTIGLVRLHAAEWHVDPHKIGVLGFSAGGHLVAATSTIYKKRLYPPIDDADRQSCRPDFAVALYPGHLLENTSREFELNPTLPVTSNTPPTFLLQATDDPVDDVQNSVVYYAALKKAGVSVEMHLYAQGKHAFGLRRTKLPITEWPQLVETWLRTIGMISE